MIILQKIVLGQTSKQFSACSSLKIGLNLDQSTCWSERKGANKVCNRESNFKTHRTCLDKLPRRDSDFTITRLYAGKAHREEKL